MNRLSIKKLFLKILQSSHKNTCVGVTFQIEMQVFSPETLLKGGSNTSVFLWILRKFLRTPFLKNICEQLFKRFAT